MAKIFVISFLKRCESIACDDERLSDCERTRQAKRVPFMSSVAANEEAPWRVGWRSARVNVLPAIALQIVALALVVAFYQHAPTRDALTRPAKWRTEVGFTFAVISTALFGGFLPFLYLRARTATRARFSWIQGAAITAFWGYKGLEIDLFYRFLAWFVGEGHDLRTIGTKMVIDQLIYCPLLAVPLTVLVYYWSETGFSAAAVIKSLRAPGWYRRKVLPLLISNLGVWVPAVCIIYALPTPLQLPLQNLVLCFFTLLVAHVVQRKP